MCCLSCIKIANNNIVCHTCGTELVEKNVSVDDIMDEMCTWFTDNLVYLARGIFLF